MDKKIIYAAVIVIILVIGGYLAWKQMGGTYSPSASLQGETQQTENQGTGEEQFPVKEITVRGSEFAFSPSEASVKPGQTVKLTFINDGQYPHNFVIEKLDIRTKLLSRGQSEIIQFAVPSDPAEFPLSTICSVPGHKEAGMVFTFKAE